ncbi:class I SAM-dependent methyltransferase [Streptomyces sp. R302]|uniref:class I SAM-dependent methyltransferase n=1 Tax=unclassified Streptomyces TaxID=2593676 RepID=UPI00145CC4EB|nr:MULTISPECIES: class I SAM-dependent methyltransferase [unclassified Streptomyces]NML50808.1 class I SAM-dependent methyltransferase [Streptomyces sp. R301]NML80902.1 class I SAM-dependent methyltransferase [Streptomyces sp. R302]
MGRERARISAEFDRRAATYEASAMHRWLAQEAVRLAAPRPHTWVLDVATGTGLAAREAAASTGGHGRVIGVDLSPGMLHVAVERSPGSCSYALADAHRLPFGADRFDLVMCVSSLPYLDARAAVREWGRVARPGAAIVFTVPTAEGVSVNRMVCQAARAEGIPLPDPHAELGTTHRLCELAGYLGLEVEDIQRVVWEGDEPLRDPGEAWRRTLDYGFGEPLRTADPAARERARRRFIEQAEGHHPRQDQFLARLTLPTPA